MKCESALELLLDAEPSEFSANGPTLLGDHLRGCVRCRRVAVQLMHDTQRLAVAIEAVVRVRRPARRALRISLAPAFVATALVVAVVLRTRPDEQTTVVTTTLSQPVVPTTVMPPAPVPNVKASRARLTPGGPVAHRALARAVPLSPVRLEPSRISDASPAVKMSGVTVTPPAGTRATVMHTSNPKLVVVWLH